MVLIVRNSDTTSSTISLSAYDVLRTKFESAKLASSFEEVVQNKYKKIQGKKTKLPFLHAIS